MGIRFYCPNGHKLHVKAFQAGMRGICPYCGAKVQIPLQSTRVSTKLQRAQRRKAAADPAARQGSQSGQADDRASAGTSAQPAATSPQLDVCSPSDVATRSSSAFEPVPEYRSFPSPLTEEEVGISLASADRIAVPPDAISPAGVPAPASGGDSHPSGPDGWDDAALADIQLVWYVRPPSGGQFGPATGDIMRQWLQEGRITPDTLVWREGWRDWRDA